ncbi:hypothetical protein TNCV_3907721 [Trichonephila clavipes]|nr:hypothetical protein TNCV_3907721 [Trichonephila clavipes]
MIANANRPVRSPQGLQTLQDSTRSSVTRLKSSWVVTSVPNYVVWAHHRHCLSLYCNIKVNHTNDPNADIPRCSTHHPIIRVNTSRAANKRTS